MNRQQKYKADQLIEAGVAEFLDDNFYSKIIVTKEEVRRA